MAGGIRFESGSESVSAAIDGGSEEISGSILEQTRVGRGTVDAIRLGAKLYKME